VDNAEADIVLMMDRFDQLDVPARVVATEVHAGPGAKDVYPHLTVRFGTLHLHRLALVRRRSLEAPVEILDEEERRIFRLAH
jgi:hypothetical protein